MQCWPIGTLCLACSDLPNQPSSTQEVTDLEHADDFDIFRAAWFHDPESSATWQTLIIHDEDRTDDNATVTLYASSGEIWQYSLERIKGAWSVGETYQFPANGEIQSSVSTTDPNPVTVAIVWAELTSKRIFFVPLEGTVISFAEFSSNAIWRLDWEHPGNSWNEFEYAGATWRADFEKWFLCYDRAEAGDGSGYQCLNETRAQVPVDHFGYDEEDFPIYAKQVYLHYSTEKTADAPDTNVASVVISPGPVSVGILDTITVSATARNASNQVLTGKSAVWTVENRGGEIATVVATGDMTASIIGQQLGTTTLIATVEGVDATVTVHVNPIITLSGPDYAETGPITVTAEPFPTGSYHYEWRVEYCVQRVGWPKYACDLQTSPNGNSGQDATSQEFSMLQSYTYARFSVKLREHAGGSVIASGSWTVNGASESICHLGICQTNGPDHEPEPTH